MSAGADGEPLSCGDAAKYGDESFLIQAEWKQFQTS